jgi:hypothetical protein
MVTAFAVLFMVVAFLFAWTGRDQYSVTVVTIA